MRGLWRALPLVCVACTHMEHRLIEFRHGALSNADPQGCSAWMIHTADGSLYAFRRGGLTADGAEFEGDAERYDADRKRVGSGPATVGIREIVHAECHRMEETPHLVPVAGLGLLLIMIAASTVATNP
jgi:hypothetical protein